MAEDTQHWLKPYLDSLQADVRYVRQQFDQLAQRLTALEARQDEQDTLDRRAQRMISVWVMGTIAAGSLLWSIVWTVTH
jgi:uncharacterized membrane protein